MRILQIATVLLLFISVSGPFNPCLKNQHTGLIEKDRNIVSRQRPFNRSLCDSDINTGWYRFTGDAGALMADSTHGPQAGDCTTAYPVYLKDPHPANLTCSDELTVDTCVTFNGIAHCQGLASVKVMNCCIGRETFFIYNLSKTEACDMAYCGIGVGGKVCPQGKIPYFDAGTGEEKCKAPFPYISKPPEMTEPQIDSGNIVIYCKVHFDHLSGNEEDAKFFVQFLFNDVVKQNATADSKSNFRATLDQWTLEGNLGKHISCRTKGMWTDYGESTLAIFSYSSNNVYAGVKVFKKGTDNEVNTIEISSDVLTPFEIELASFLPITTGSHDANQVAFTFHTKHADVIVPNECGTAFYRNDIELPLPIRSNPITVYPAFDGKKRVGVWPHRFLSFNKLAYGIHPITKLPLHQRSIWQNYALPPIPIRLNESNSAECTSVTDPHITTFYNIYYNNYIAGEFVLSKLHYHDFYFEVRERHWKCNNVQCNCAVAARENNDIFIIDLCYSNWTIHRELNVGVAPRLWYRSVKEAELMPAPGADIYKEEGGRAFTVNFPSGAWVRAVINVYWGLDITVHVPSYFHKRGTTGMCAVSSTPTDRRHLNRTLISNKVKDNDTYFNPNIPPKPVFQAQFEYNSTYCHCQNVNGSGNSIICDYTQLITDKANVDRATNISHIIPKQRNGKIRRKRDLRSGNDMGDDEIHDFSRFTYDFDFNKNNEVPNIPDDWPTNAGRTQKEVEDLCDNKLKASPVYTLCQDVPDFDIESNRRQCVEDIQITDILESADVAVQLMELNCLTQAEKIEIAPTPLVNESTLDPVVGSSPPPLTSQILDQIRNYVCPSNCSGKGRCMLGTCECFPGYISADCSVDLHVGPAINGLDGSGLCDIRDRRCEAINVYVSNAADNPGVICRFEMHKIDITTGRRIAPTISFKMPGNLISFGELVCPLPKQDIDTPFVDTAPEGMAIQSFDLTVSNDGYNISSNSTKVTIYDSKCTECNGHDCKRKNDTCLINGYCYENGEADPVHEACRICDVKRNNDKWTNKSEPAIPCSLCSGVPCSCSGNKWKCDCRPGFINDRNGTCTDIDECQTKDICGVNSVCINTEGSFMCQCQAGFSMNAGNVCTDLDECQLSNPCSPREDCTNTPGSYRCTCKTGFTGDNCADTNECAQLNVCDRYADCINTEGSFVCRPRPSGCPLHYLNLNDKCYVINNTALNFSDSRDACRNQNADLAMLRTILEYKILAQKVLKSSGFYWIGITDLETELTFTYVDDTAVSYTPSWDPGRPSATPSNADCVAINSGNSYSYTDRPCGEFSAFICQAPWRQPVIPIG